MLSEISKAIIRFFPSAWASSSDRYGAISPRTLRQLPRYPLSAGPHTVPAASGNASAKNLMIALYLKQLEVGLMQNFNYLIGDPGVKECAYVDPAWEVDRVLRQAKADGHRVTKILLTHNHFDHIEGVSQVLRETGAEVYIHGDDQKPVVKEGRSVTSLHSGDEIVLGSLQITALSTPGHTPGSTCYLVHETKGGIDHLFTGDTLFQGNCGRSDLPGGDPRILFKSLQFIKSLDPATKIYPGHDYGIKPVTTIAYEKQHNPTLKAGTFEEFDRLP